MQSTARELRDVTELDMRTKFRQARELLQRINYLAKDVSTDDTGIIHLAIE